MQCPQCQHENRSQAKFCEECAAPLARTCPQCGSQLSATAKFCSECSHPVDRCVAPQQRFTSPQAYTPKHLAEKILTSKSALEGERKQVTVLFADLKGSMELLADRDPEEARKLLDPVLERMMEAVHHYEGTVNQVMGDGIMALFGAPVAHEDHAVRACYAAMRMQRRVTLYADEVQQKGGTPVQIRVGVNSGEVVVRAIGSDLHMDYTAVGQTTHLAARLEQMAKPGSTLVTGETLKLAEGYVQARPLGAVPVKGLEAPTPVYELTGIVSARSRFQASTARGLTRFVGRATELQQLGQALERAAMGHGQTVAVVGEAGVGKSRLLWEFTRSHRTHGWLVLESGSVSYGTATPYLPVIDLLKAYCRIQERDDSRAIRERMAGKLLMLDRTLEPLLTPLLALLDVPIDDPAWANLDPPQRRQRTLEAVKRLLLRESQVQPLLVVFEDLHWIDSETQALLDGLVESLPTARLLLLVNYRPEYQHAWGGKTYYLQLRIDPLPPESTQELLAALLGEDRALEPLWRVLIARTEGNPFFLEESVQALVETRVLVGERGAYRLGKAPDAWQIPATAQAILAARIDRLAPEDKRLLQAASVVGKDVPFPLLEAIADLPEASLRQGLARLQAAEFLYETSLFPDLEYTFKHALTHEVAYGSLVQDRRRALHAAIVKTMEHLYADRLAEQTERLAYHAVRGEIFDKAAQYLYAAGTRAVTRSMYREGVAYLEQALSALGHLPRSSRVIEQDIDLRLRLHDAMLPLGGPLRSADHVAVADALAEGLGDPRRIGWTSIYRARAAWVEGDNRHAVVLGERARLKTKGVDHLPLELSVNLILGQIYHSVGDYDRAVASLEANVERLSRDLAYERFDLPSLPSVISREYLALSLAEQGRFTDALAQGAEALRIATAVDHPYSRVVADLGIGGALLRRGELSGATRTLEHALVLCQATSLRVAMPIVVSYLGLALTQLGRVTEGITYLEQAFRDADAVKRLDQHALRLTYLGEGYLEAGRHDEATLAATRAATFAREHNARGEEAWAIRLFADIAGRSGPPEVDTATRRYVESLTLARELAMRPLVAHCHLGLGTLYRRTGDHAMASEHLVTATTMYREMGMSFWLEKADVAMAGLL